MPDRSPRVEPLEQIEQLIATVLQELADASETLASCESLTGGLVGALITGVPGASRVYRGGLISYATELKASLAGVPDAVLDRHGAVAAETAAAMARGAATVCRATWGVATTGVAGPDPQEGHRPGTVFVAVSGPASAVRSLHLDGDRESIRRQTTWAVVELLASSIQDDPRRSAISS